MIERRHRRWCVMDLVTDHHTGKLRETLVWSNFGKAALLWGFFWQLHHDGISEWYAGIMVGALIMHELGSRLMNQKQQALDIQEQPK